MPRTAWVLQYLGSDAIGATLSALEAEMLRREFTEGELGRETCRHDDDGRCPACDKLELRGWLIRVRTAEQIPEGWVLYEQQGTRWVEFASGVMREAEAARELLARGASKKCAVRGVSDGGSEFLANQRYSALKRPLRVPGPGEPER